MIDKIGENSKREGRKTSRLPIMSDEMKSSLSNSADFLALNYYTSNFISPAKYIEDEISYQNDAGVRMDVDKNWVKAESSQWLYSVPRGMHDLLVWIKENYNNPEVLITENGFSDFGEIEDEGRVSYIRSHLEWTSKAIGKGCNVVGYTCWSLIDNFEWLSGYTEKFGVFSVNFSIPEKTRTPKKSAEFLKKLISQLNKN
jgi:beta-glucosidase/6-phospho-beta-glucosidase/beta-galactosidase